MIAVWMLYALLTGALLGGAALVAEWACRARRWPTRWAWAAALALTAILTALAPVRVTLPRTVMTFTAGGAATPSPAAMAADASLARRAMDAVASLRAAVGEPWDALVRTLARGLGDARAHALDAWLLAAWALASLACLVVALVVARRLARARRAWPEVALHGQRVRLAPGFGPAVVGVRDAHIVVPGWLLACAAPVQRLVLAHEREHLRARDPRLLALGGAVVIAMPWHPLAWWMLARLRLAVELDCDRRVLAGGVAPADYGALLLDVAGRGTGIPFGSPMLGIPTLATRTTHIERRLVAMTTPRARFARTRLVAAATLAVGALLAACESRLPTSAELERMDIGAVEEKLDLHADSVTFYVDDVLTTAAEARAIDAKRIATVSVSKNEATDLREVRIATRNELVDSLLPSKRPAPTLHGANATVTEVGGFQGIVVIDGVRSTESALRRLAPNTISTIDVFKGSHAQALFPNDPVAAKGVIRVWTKAAK